MAFRMPPNERPSGSRGDKKAPAGRRVNAPLRRPGAWEWVYYGDPPTMSWADAPPFLVREDGGAGCFEITPVGGFPEATPSSGKVLSSGPTDVTQLRRW